MNIESVVIHEIIKKEKTTTAELKLSDSEASIKNDMIIQMIELLDASFAKKTPRRAKFSEDGFKSKVGNFEKINLLNSSKDLAKNLKERIEGISQAKGGYLVFCKYTTNKKFIAIYLVRDTNGSLLKFKADKSWDINATEYLDIENFAMGAKINLDILGSDSDDRYVSLVKGNTDISEYFSKWIGLDDTKSESKDADALYDVSNKIDLPPGIVNRDELKKKIHDYVKNSPKKIVNIRSLSSYLYEDENFIQEYCEKNDFDIDGEFKLSGKQLSKFHKVSVAAGGIELSFPRSSFCPQGVEVQDGVVIIRSSALAAEISRVIKE